MSAQPAAARTHLSRVAGKSPVPKVSSPAAARKRRNRVALEAMRLALGAVAPTSLSER